MQNEPYGQPPSGGAPLQRTGDTGEAVSRPYTAHATPGLKPYGTAATAEHNGSRNVPPETVVVGVHRYSIQELTIEHASDTDQYGLIEYKTQVIRLRRATHPDSMRETLLHEIIHACFRESGSPLKFGTEEKAVRALASNVLGVLRRNPQLVAYLTGGEE
jgi:hypothetical protein